MDGLANQLSNVSLYDVKASFRKAQNAVLNFSDMEAKVREATNNEPWGTPTSIMQQIADGTNNYQQFHEIMPFVYRRFTEKSAHSWRQIYKALQLLEYLVKNGSERVVDYARSHIAVVELLRHFSYIDSKGVDQGESIRRRSDELVKLLNSTELLRAERKKAKQLNSKTAAGSSSTSTNPSFNAGGFGGSGRKYGGFSSDAYRSMKFGGAASQQVFGDGGGFDGSNHIVSGRDYENEEFEEYVVEESVKPKETKNESKTVARQQEDDDDDEFAEFEAAPTPVPAATATTSASILDLFSAPSTTQPPVAQPLGLFSAMPTGLPAVPAATTAASPAASATAASGQPPFAAVPVATAAPAQTQAKPSVDLFGSLWETGKTTTLAKPEQKSHNPAPATKPAFEAANSASPTPTPTQSAPTAQPGATAQHDAVVDLLSF